MAGLPGEGGTREGVGTEGVGLVVVKALSTRVSVDE